MSNDAESDVVHLKAGEHLPAVPISSPTTEMLKQLLAQMLENERRRLRNEYVRISMLFLALLVLAIGGGLWFARSLLDQLRAERQTTERSLQILLGRDAQDRDQRSEVRDQSSAIINQQSEISNKFAPALRADTSTVQAQADIKRILADLEAKKQTLADMLQTQDAQTQNMLQSRDNELQTLHKHMDEMQRKIMNAAPSEALMFKPAKAPPEIEEPAAESLTIITTNAVKLRLPIPSP
jgi:cytoskeletal protein RodZ